MNFPQLQNNLQQVIDSIDIIVLESAMDNESTMADLQTEQMSLGLMSNGDFIRPELYSDEYAYIKVNEGGKAPLYTPDLHDTGAFYRGVYAKISGNAIETTSTDEKADDLTAKYGPLIFGLNQTQLGKLSEFILPDVQKKIKNGLINSRS